MGSENHHGPVMPFPQTSEVPDTRHYRVDIADGQEGCTHCSAGAFYTVVYTDDDAGDVTEIGTSWADRELAEDICDLMNMAYEAGREASDAAAQREAGHED